MKRFNKTAVALATAGAMTLAIVPNASALPNPGGDPSVSDYEKTNEDPFSFDNPGPNAAEQPDTPPNTDTNVPATGINDVRDNPNAVELPNENVPRRLGQTPGDVFVTEDENGVRTTSTVPTPVPEDYTVPGRKPGTINWGDVIVGEDGKLARVDGKVLIGAKNGQQVMLEDGDKIIPAGKIGVGILGALAGVTIAGVLYNVVKNSKGEPVLVPADRADQTPTAEDEKKTKELVDANKDEIVAQAIEQNAGAVDAAAADSAATDRGVGAATGNNTIAKGLVGLLIASIMGAAVFAFGRRRLV